MRASARRTLTGAAVLLFSASLCISYWNLSGPAVSNGSRPNDEHLLCVLIPFRNVEFELSQLVPELHVFLNNQSVQHVFIVLNQTDSFRFNRASLINVGWYEAKRAGCDYMVMHDVDIVPLNPALNYRFQGKGVVRHISSGDYHPIKRERNMTAGIERPHGLSTGRRDTFKHIHGPSRKRDYALIGNQKEMSRKRDRQSGLDTVQYEVKRRETLRLQDVPVTSVHVELVCDFAWTPYCSFDH